MLYLFLCGRVNNPCVGLGGGGGGGGHTQQKTLQTGIEKQNSDVVDFLLPASSF